MPLGRPLYEKTDATRLAGLRRDVEHLRRRGAGRWIYVGTYPVDPNTTIDSPTFADPWLNSGDADASTDELTRFRWLQGGGLEIQVNVTGGAEGTIIFTLPTSYWDGGKQTVPADNNGTYFPLTIVPRTDGSGEADVYAGRV